MVSKHIKDLSSTHQHIREMQMTIAHHMRLAYIKRLEATSIDGTKVEPSVMHKQFKCPTTVELIDIVNKYTHNAVLCVFHL